MVTCLFIINKNEIQKNIKLKEINKQKEKY